MLSTAQVVAVRRAIESTYLATCDILEQVKTRGADGSTCFQAQRVQTAVPCKLSFESNTSTSDTGGASGVTQTTKLFLAPELVVSPGSQLIVTQNGVTTAYQDSGTPARYATHQEIQLELTERWA